MRKNHSWPDGQQTRSCAVRSGTSPAVRCRSSLCGFTLVEMLLATVISVVVFSAMGALLVKTLQLWGEGVGQFHVARVARVARARLLSGGMGPGTGLLSVNAITSVKTNTQWCTLDYDVAARSEKFTVRGSVDDDSPANKSVFIKSNQGGGQTWLAMVGTKRGQQNLPDVTAMWFDATRSNQWFGASQTNKYLTVSYMLSWEFGGKTYDYPQVIQSYLINE